MQFIRTACRLQSLPTKYISYSSRIRFNKYALTRSCDCHMITTKRFASQTSSNRKVPISWTSLVVLLVAGGGVLLYVKKLKREKEEASEKERTRSLGKAALGGPFSLTDHNGKVKTDKDFLGQWILIYFGFTFCPDICPDELEKMANTLDMLDKTEGLPKLQPLFISVDPERDTPEILKNYLKEFHPRILGLTGTNEEVHQATKAYRVYYSMAPADDDNDYLVDHTIIMYLVDPNGNFVDYYGQNRTAQEMTAGIANHMIKYKTNR